MAENEDEMAMISPDSVGSLEFQGSQGSNGEKEEQKELTPNTEEMNALMGDINVNHSFTSLREGGGSVIDHTTLKNIFTERVYYGSNGAPEPYLVHFAITKRFVWNSQEEEQNERINELHEQFIEEFQKSNKKASIYFQDRKIRLPFTINPTTSSQRQSMYVFFPPKEQTAEWWEKKVQADKMKEEVVKLERQASKAKKLADDATMKAKEAQKKRKTLEMELGRTTAGRYDEDDDEERAVKAFGGGAAATMELEKGWSIRAYHYWLELDYKKSEWDKTDKEAFYLKHKEEIDEPKGRKKKK